MVVRSTDSVDALLLLGTEYGVVPAADAPAGSAVVKDEDGMRLPSMLGGRRHNLDDGFLLGCIDVSLEFLLIPEQDDTR